MILKKIFNKISDEEVHSDFLKFGKGVFSDKYLLEAKRQKDKWVVKTGPEFANDLVKSILQDSPGSFDFSGVVVSTLEMDIPFSDGKKQFMGIKQYKVNSKINSKDILEVMDKYPRAFFALSFKTADSELKIKAKAPKSAKPSTKGDKEAKADFCSLKTTNKKIIGELFFDFPDFDVISIRHTINVDSIIYPAGVQNMKPEEVRFASKRKGSITREVSIDGKTEFNKIDFIV